MNINDYPLRDRKYAKTKIAIANAFVERLKTARFNDISIKDVCESVEVSEGTFYNYFPHKIDLICYFHRIKLLKLIWDIKQNKVQMSPLQTLEYLFDVTAKEMQDPFLFYEIISLYMREQVRPSQGEDLTPAEKACVLPDCPGVEEIRILSLEDFLSQLVAAAQQDHTISAAVQVSDIVLSLMSTLVGIPLIIDMKDFGRLKELYKTQLSLIWKGLGVDERG